VRRRERSVAVLCHLVDFLNKHSDFLVHLVNVLTGVAAGGGSGSAERANAEIAE
jgi:hypothetical protein